MREIKFRYWCKVDKEMYDKAYVEEHLKLAFMSELIEAAQERYVFMQYTGLKDKNGTEIYEGDIVSLPNLFSDIKDRRYKVEYNTHGEWSIGTHLLSHKYPACKVIGNAYENPELLEG